MPSKKGKKPSSSNKSKSDKSKRKKIAKGKVKRTARTKTVRLDKISKRGLPDVSLIRSHRTISKEQNNSRIISIEPVPGTDLNNSTHIIFNYTVPINNILRFEQQPVIGRYEMEVWRATDAADATNLISSGKDDATKGAWHHMKDDGSFGFVPPYAQFETFFDDLELYLNSRPIGINPGMGVHMHLYSFLHKALTPRAERDELYGNSASMVAQNWYDPNVVYHGRSETDRAAEWSACATATDEERVITRPFRPEGIPFLSQAKNYQLTSRLGERYPLTNPWLPAGTEIRIVLRKRLSVGSMLVTKKRLTSTYFNKAIKPLINEQPPPVKMKWHSLNLSAELRDLSTSPSTINRFISSTYFFDLPRIQIHNLPAEASRIPMAFPIPEKTKIAYVWFGFNWQLWFSETARKGVDARAVFPLNLKTAAITFGNKPLITELPITNLNDVSGTNCDGYLQLENYYKVRGWLDTYWGDIKNVNGKMSYRQFFAVDLSGETIEPGQNLNVYLQFAEGALSPKEMVVACITVEEVPLSRHANDWKMGHI